MAENKTNIYDLMNEVNKNKSKSSMSKENTMNDIFDMLDEIKKDNNISVDEVKQRVNSTKSQESEIHDSLENYSNVVVKPTVPEHVDNYDTYSDCLLQFIRMVNYGTNNSKEYVRGHKAALEKYYSEISNNKKDIYVVEGSVNDEINGLVSKEGLYDKGYYDGLFYILRSLKKAKALMTSKLNTLLKEKIK